MQLAHALRRKLSRDLPGTPWAGVVPMPARKFDPNHPAVILAKALAGQLRLPYRPILRFRRTVPSQRGLKRKERLRNMRHALVAKIRLQRSRLLVVDDVMTTGATVHECARALKKAGARIIDVAVLARSGDFAESNCEPETFSL